MAKPEQPGELVGHDVRGPAIRATLLFVNFFLIITALYHLKPASRSLFIEAMGANKVPYVWIATALVMGFVIASYHRLVERYRRLTVALGTCLFFIGSLVLFRVLFTEQNSMVAAAFYIFVDILSVVLVEQFWSLTNTLHSTEDGKRWYGFVGTGGLVGGVVGGGLAALIISRTPLQTPDLLLVAAFIIALVAVLNSLMGWVGIYRETSLSPRQRRIEIKWSGLGRNRYLLLIASILLLAQLVSPLVGYQFLNTVEVAYQELEARTAFLSVFFGGMGLISIAVNLGITPLVHRYLGVIAGLLVQPLMLVLCSYGFVLQPGLLLGAALKISDRGLSYSINRASKELLYVPIDPVLIYQAKAWIDMFGYRLFKGLGSLLILLLTQWLPLQLGLSQLSWLTLAICGVWIAALIYLQCDYQFVTGDGPCWGRERRCMEGCPLD